MTEHLDILNRIKYLLWRYAITPIFPYLRDALLKTHLIRHIGRQPWLIGWLDQNKTLDEFLVYLETIGFYNHFVAWVDDGQIVSFRKRDGFERQYHLRIFDDGEVRGHYELTPEAHPLGHFNEEYFESRLSDFQKWLGDWVTDRHPESAVGISVIRAFSDRNVGAD